MMEYFNPRNPFGLAPEVPDLKDLPKEKQEEVRKKAAMFGCLSYLFWAFIAIIICAMMSGCTTTRYVPVIEHKTDTLIQTSHQRDSIYMHDSIFVNQWQQGDTVYQTRDRWHTRYVEREVHDTTYIARHDTVPQPVKVTEYVERELALWQRGLMWMGVVGLLVTLLWIWKTK